MKKHIELPEILETAVSLTAKYGTEGVSMRSVAKKLDIPPSLLCYHFHTKAEMLCAMCSYASDTLTVQRQKLSVHAPLNELLKARIVFQFDHAVYVVAILKYYMGNRHLFRATTDGYLPSSAYRHIEEVLAIGKSRGECHNINIPVLSKIIAHTINGYVLEYFPHKIPQQQKDNLAKILTGSFLTLLNYPAQRQS
jgi:AcrR family transcriptional regulator